MQRGALYEHKTTDQELQAGSPGTKEARGGTHVGTYDVCNLLGNLWGEGGRQRQIVAHMGVHAVLRFRGTGQQTERSGGKERRQSVQGHNILQRSRDLGQRLPPCRAQREAVDVAR